MEYQISRKVNYKWLQSEANKFWQILNLHKSIIEFRGPKVLNRFMSKGMLIRPVISVISPEIQHQSLSQESKKRIDSQRMSTRIISWTSRAIMVAPLLQCRTFSNLNKESIQILAMDAQTCVDGSSIKSR